MHQMYLGMYERKMHRVAASTRTGTHAEFCSCIGFASRFECTGRARAACSHGFAALARIPLLDDAGSLPRFARQRAATQLDPLRPQQVLGRRSRSEQGMSGSRAPRRLVLAQVELERGAVSVGRDREGRSPSGVGVIRREFLRVATCPIWNHPQRR